MDGFWQGVWHNRILWITFLGWAVAQGAKIALGTVKEKRFNFKWLLGTGGMPSSHSAAVVALAMCVGKELGFSSPFFALSSVFALITMFDAQTWRRSIGAQARILNRMMSDLQEMGTITEDKLRELVGHTPIEVLVGALIGIIVSLLFY